MILAASELFLVLEPPSSPVPLVDAAWGPLVAAARMVKWVCLAIAVAGVLAIGTLLMIDNRLVDQYGPSIQAILIKVIAGLLILATAAQIAELFAA